MKHYKSKYKKVFLMSFNIPVVATGPWLAKSFINSISLFVKLDENEK